MVKQKGLAPIFIVILITIVLSSGYLTYRKVYSLVESFTVRTTTNLVNKINQQSNIESSCSAETTRWDTYTNDALGFSIKYPQNIDEYYFSDPTSSSIQISLPKTNDPYLSRQDNKLLIMWSPNSGLALEEDIDNTIRQQKARTPGSIFEKAPYSIDGQAGMLLTEKRPPDYERKILYISTNQAILHFSIMYRAQDKEQTSKLFDQVVSTFKFSNPNQANTKWRTYRDAEYGFSLQFPPGLSGYKISDPDASFEAWRYTENNIGPGVNVNSISFEIYAKEIRPSYLRGVTPQERMDYEELLSLNQGESLSDTGEIGFNCTTYTRGPITTINGNNWVSFNTSKNNKKCRPATQFFYERLLILQKDDVIYKFSVIPYTDKADDRLFSYLNQILSTFEFIP